MWTAVGPFNDSTARVSASEQAIPIQDFQGFKSFGFLFAEACFQASKCLLKQTQIWNWMWEWEVKPKPQPQLMTIGSLELKKKYSMRSCKKTALWESWLSSNSPVQWLLFLNGRYYQSDVEQDLFTSLPPPSLFPSYSEFLTSAHCITEETVWWGTSSGWKNLAQDL